MQKKKALRSSHSDKQMIRISQDCLTTFLAFYIFMKGYCRNYIFWSVIIQGGDVIQVLMKLRKTFANNTLPIMKGVCEYETNMRRNHGNY